MIPSIYETYKLYGGEDIVDTTLIPDEQHLELELAKLGARAEDAINYTWDATGDVSARDLSAWTHKPDSPWAEAFKPDTMSIPIRNDRHIGRRRHTGGQRLCGRRADPQCQEGRTLQTTTTINVIGLLVIVANYLFNKNKST